MTRLPDFRWWVGAGFMGYKFYARILRKGDFRGTTPVPLSLQVHRDTAQGAAVLGAHQSASPSPTKSWCEPTFCREFHLAWRLAGVGDLQRLAAEQRDEFGVHVVAHAGAVGDAQTPWAISAAE